VRACEHEWGKGWREMERESSGRLPTEQGARHGALFQDPEIMT